MTIANVDAVPLYLHCLGRAAPELQLRGLQIWRKLLQSNMANLSAADRYPASCTSFCVKQGCALMPPSWSQPLNCLDVLVWAQRCILPLFCS